MQIRQLLSNINILIIRLIRYNLKVIFANKFIYFLLGAVSIFLTVTAVNLFYGNTAFDEEGMYRTLLLSGILIIFYPVTFGIQNDSDNRMLEIIFCIPSSTVSSVSPGHPNM